MEEKREGAKPTNKKKMYGETERVEEEARQTKGKTEQQEKHIHNHWRKRKKKRQMANTASAEKTTNNPTRSDRSKRRKERSMAENQSGRQEQREGSKLKENKIG